MWLVYVVLAIEIAIGLYGFISSGTIGIAIIMTITMCVFPGMLIFFHSIFHFSVKLEVFDDHFVVTSYDPLERFLRVSHQQQLAFKDVSYAYYLGKEIDFLKEFIRHANNKQEAVNVADLFRMGIDGEISFPQATQESMHGVDDNICKVFLNTKLNFPKYISAEEGSRGGVATARIKTCLVLSNNDGSQKVYFANFYDLSGEDSQHFLKTLKEKNGNIQFLMDPAKIKRLFGSGEE